MKTNEEKKLLEKMKETRKNLLNESIVNIINLVDELKQSKEEEYDDIEKSIKQGLYLIKYIISTD